MQNIHIQRYSGSPAWQGSIAPEDRSWIVFIDKDGEATFWRRVPADRNPRSIDEDLSKIEHTYVDAELPSVLCDGDAPPLPMPTHGPHDALDFTIIPNAREPFGDALSREDHEREAAAHPDARIGFYAALNVRSIMCWGETEHEAVRGLLNYVARLCTAGSLDHTGQPVLGNPRRYKAVWGDKR